MLPPATTAARKIRLDDDAQMMAMDYMLLARMAPSARPPQLMRRRGSGMQRSGHRATPAGRSSGSAEHPAAQSSLWDQSRAQTRRNAEWSRRRVTSRDPFDRAEMRTALKLQTSAV